MSTAGSLGMAFDLNSQSGVMAVLVAVRHSALSPAQKNELRDLVFQYSNGGGDVTVRRALEQKITTYALTPVAVVGKAANEPKVPPAPPRPYGTTRPAPHFTPVLVPTSKPVVTPTPPVVESVAVAVPVTPVSPVVEASVVPPTPVVPPVEAAPLPVASVPAPTAPAAASAVDAALVRIRDIKAAVNQKVGNPVNLVDIDNTVGREYMVAMLEAMKRVAGNTPGDLGVAMSRLESAYTAVEAAIAAHGTAVPPATPTPVPTIAPTPVVPEPVPVVQVAPVAPAVAPAPAATAAYAVPVVEAQGPAPFPEAPVEPVAVPVPAVPAAPPRFATLAEELPMTPPPAFRAASLAEDPVHLRTPQDLPDPASLATSSVSGDPLFTNEVDTGLEQLLAEWVIFKKSGLFGTGPRGREHPLFKTLATLAIPIILAGRYDGATPEIRQSITDYMNGWRYEQGIIYEQDETFEHYLRRVIHHIIDLQKRRRQA
jgi:hypothetical protein